MPLESFSALDFETATWYPSSVCQIGIVRMENGEVVEEVNELSMVDKLLDEILDAYSKNPDIRSLPR